MTLDTGGAWVILFAVAAAIELFAIVTHRRTLSQQVWAASARHRWWTVTLVSAGMLALWGHFFLNWWR